MLGFLALFATNWLTVLVPQLIGQAVDALEVAHLPGVAIERARWIFPIAIGIVVARTLSRVCFFNPGRAIEFSLKNHTFRHLLTLPPSWYATQSVGDLISRSTNDLSYVRAFVGFAGLQICNVLLSVPLTLWKMWQMSPDLTLWVMLPLGLALLVLWVSVRMLSLTMRRSLKELSELSDHILDTYNAIPMIQGWNAILPFSQRYHKLNDNYTSTQIRISALRSVLIPIIYLFANLALVGVIWWGGQRVLQAKLTVGVIAAFASYIALLVGQFISIGWTLNSLQRGYLSLCRVYEVLDAQPEFIRGSLALPAPTQNSFGVEVKDLSFAYPGESRPDVLKNLSFRIGPGEVLGVFGPTGSGKSTLLQLLAGLWLTPPGSVRVGGVDLRDLSPHHFRQEMALVPQDPFLLSRPLRENIGWCEPPPGVDPKKHMTRAAELACLTDDITRLAQGFDTEVGARGVTLSGGQRQRTALARAFYRPFRLLLLDDVLSAVDHATESRLIQNIQTASGGATTVVVAHRISALQHTHSILVLDKGQMVDLASHEILLTRCQLYRDTWQAQQDRGEADHG